LLLLHIYCPFFVFVVVVFGLMRKYFDSQYTSKNANHHNAYHKSYDTLIDMKILQYRISKGNKYNPKLKKKKKLLIPHSPSAFLFTAKFFEVQFEEF